MKRRTANQSEQPARSDEQPPVRDGEAIVVGSVRRAGAARQGSMPTFSGVVNDLAELIAERVAAKILSGTMSDFVDQASSPLGPRRHIAAIRTGKLVGTRVGRRYLARRQDVDEFVARTRRPSRTTSEHRGNSVGDSVDALADELGISLNGKTQIDTHPPPSGEEPGALTTSEGMDRNE